MHLTRPLTTNRGVSAIGLLVVLAVIAAAASIAVPMLLDSPQFSREQKTRYKMHELKAAIIGFPDRMPERERHSFGFVGDLGVLPVELEDLFLIGSYPGYSPTPVNHVQFGWRGPYLDSTLTAAGHRLALLDAWGTPFNWTGDAISRTITSAGPDTDFLTSEDNLLLHITEDDWRTTVTGQFFDPYRIPLNETELSIYYPDGTASLAVTVLTPLDPHSFNSETDIMLSGSDRKIPIGLRAIVSRDLGVTFLAALNGGPLMNFTIIGPEQAQDAILFENSFSDPSDLGPLGANTPLKNIRGNWTVSGGDLSSSWGHVAFGLMGWRDYRLEADVTLLTDSRGYGVYYRSTGDEQISGYIFQFDPGLYGPFGDGIELVIRRVYLGNENYFPSPMRFLARNRYNRVQFESIFGTRIWNDSHHISITVLDKRHIVKLNGIPVIDVIDEQPLFPCGGLCGMAGFRTWNGMASFHHVLVHTIPPLPNGEIVRWPFEEGNGNRFFGSGFLIDGPEQNGIVSGAQRLPTGGVYGAAIRLTDDQFLTLADHNDIDLSGAGTLSIWIYPEERNQRLGGLIHKGNLENLNDLAYSLVFLANNRLEFRLANPSGQMTALSSNKQFDSQDQNRWQHIVAVWDSNGMAIYINGVLNAQNGTGVAVRNTAAPLNLGARFTHSIHPQRRNHPFLGRIDEVQLFSQRLTSAQIMLLYQKRVD